MLMFKRTLLAALASVALFAACDKEKEKEEVIPVSFSSFGFYAKDNADVLKTDYIVDNVTSDAISFTLPYGTDPEALKSLVPEFTVTEGASVNVADASGAPDGKDIVSGVTAVDFSSTVQLVVFLKNNFKAYSVTVKIAEPAKWGKVAESSLVMKSNPAFAINPKDGVPYVAGSSVNADGVAEPHILKLEGAELKDVAGALATGKSDGFAINFDASGVPFVAFADGSVSNKMSVVRVADGKGSYVGEAGQMFATSASFSSVAAVFPVSDKDIWCAHYNNTNKVAVPRRGLNLARFDGSAWSNGQAIEGRAPAAYANGVIGKTINGESYLYVYGTQTKTIASHISLYKLNNGAWSTIFENLEVAGTDGSTVGGYSAFFSDFDVASDGNIYFLFGATFDGGDNYEFGVVKYDPVSKKQLLIGGAMTDVLVSTKYTMGSIALDSNDVPYVALAYTEGDVKKTAVRHIDAKTKTWSELTPLGTNASFATIRFDESGKGYIVSVEESEAGDKYVLYSTAE